MWGKDNFWERGKNHVRHECFYTEFCEKLKMQFKWALKVENNIGQNATMKMLIYKVHVYV